MEVDADMNVLSWESLVTPFAVGCLLLVLALVTGCSCESEADASPPTDMPSDIPSPTSTLPPPELDTSLLTDEPCRAPCWHNIIPGVSDEEEVRAQLQDNPLIKQGTLEEYGEYEVEGITYNMFYWLAQGEHPNRIGLREGLVLSVEIWVDHDWTLGDVVDKFGPPEYVFAYRYGVEEQGFHVEFYYPDQGLEFESSLYPFTEEYLVTKDLKVTLGVYFAPTTLEGMISDVYSYSPDAMKDWLEDIHEWEGFGEVELAH